MRVFYLGISFQVDVWIISFTWVFCAFFWSNNISLETSIDFLLPLNDRIFELLYFHWACWNTVFNNFTDDEVQCKIFWMSGLLRDTFHSFENRIYLKVWNKLLEGMLRTGRLSINEMLEFTSNPYIHGEKLVIFNL